MKKQHQSRGRLPRFLLWSHALGVAGFYLYNWWRTLPGKNDHVYPLPAGKQPAQQPFVSIIVPARNEELNIRRCVESLLEQDYEHFEVIVVNDGSTDATGKILEDIGRNHPAAADRLYVLQLRDLPAGWTGKPHAMHSGAQEARGEWLLFTDADTYHQSYALRTAVNQALKERIDLYTLGVAQELPTFWEKTLMPLAYMGISMLYPPRKVNNPGSPIALAAGPFILIRRKVYETLGGFARPELCNTLVDDLMLARTVKENGYRIRFLDGRQLVSVRMYRSFREIWRGWLKNSYLGNRGGVPFFFVQIVGLFMVTVMPFLLPLLLLSRRWRKTALAVSLCELLPLGLYRSWLNQNTGIPERYTLTHPLAGLIFMGILGQSGLRILTGKGVEWRGRRYHATPEAEPVHR
ncbi:chlorobactene glucosyltransferase [Thermosporothrix hazakensis]|jgi:chlorobactene glucosyltransferase|uniref:Chlorobactene glucosyltransferase n=2 Tax=Thermosporothrix TaxID=768650 RepID=A0A326UHM0_THEHA|nr:glycosyltransferase [Thermosporothrix hazakensis]PZW27440.1 chlorobactene glucosyltransferase [Thermosporothrix hazakensis]BBH85968.1 glycosyl hydrolase [Thermosporothrix sp. COM3]GCE45607.1 glycosyl hydrolase [Thermosporothrix hazakensis]